jgi:recombination associated protein RdgC
MLFKNLMLYRLPANWNVSAQVLEAALARRLLQPCGSLEMDSRGWVPASPYGLLYTNQGQHLIALGINQKILPASVIRQVVQEQAGQFEKEQGRRIGTRELRELKQRVRDELCAKALTRHRSVRAWIDPTQGYLIVDAASASGAEALVQMLRDSLGTLAVTPVETGLVPQEAMASWIRQGEAPLRLTLDTDLELQRADEHKPTVRYVRHSLDGEDIQAHLAAGKAVTRLGLTWNDRVTFVLTHKLELRRVKFLCASTPTDDRESSLTAHEQFDRDFTLMTGELAQLLRDLQAALEVEPQSEALAA